MFSRWNYRRLAPQAARLKSGNPARMKAICSGERKSDKLDARILADLLRCDMFPIAYLMPPELGQALACRVCQPSSTLAVTRPKPRSRCQVELRSRSSKIYLAFIFNHLAPVLGQPHFAPMLKLSPGYHLYPTTKLRNH